jgi:hypothetical protein
MFLKETMDLAIVAKLTAALLNVLDPVQTCVLNFGRKTTLNPPSLDLGYKLAGSIYTTYILLE